MLQYVPPAYLLNRHLSLRKEMELWATGTGIEEIVRQASDADEGVQLAEGKADDAAGTSNGAVVSPGKHRSVSMRPQRQWTNRGSMVFEEAEEEAAHTGHRRTTSQMTPSYRAEIRALVDLLFEGVAKEGKGRQSAADGKDGGAADGKAPQRLTELNFAQFGAVVRKLPGTDPIDMNAPRDVPCLRHRPCGGWWRTGRGARRLSVAGMMMYLLAHFPNNFGMKRDESGGALVPSLVCKESLKAASKDGALWKITTDVSNRPALLRLRLVTFCRSAEGLDRLRGARHGRRGEREGESRSASPGWRGPRSW